MDAMKFIARLARILPVYGVMDNECYSDLHCLTVAADLQFASKSLDIHLQKLQTNPFGVFVAVLRQADKAPFYLFFFHLDTSNNLKQVGQNMITTLKPYYKK